MAIGLGLNAFGQGFSSGANAGANIAQSARAQDAVDYYKQRQNEKDKVTAMTSTLGDIYNGDVNEMLNDPAGQQIALDFMMSNPDIADKINSNKGWKASALLQGQDGKYKVMLQNGDGEFRPLTVDRKSGTQPAAYSKKDLYALMAGTAAKHGVANNSQNLQFLKETMPEEDFNLMQTYANGEQPDVPKAPSIAAVSTAARSANKDNAITTGSATPTPVTTGVPLATQNTDAAIDKHPTNEPIEPEPKPNPDSLEGFDLRTKNDITKLAAEGVNFKDFPDRTKQYLRDEAVAKGVQLRDLDYGLTVDDEDEIAGAAPEGKPALAQQTDDAAVEKYLASRQQETQDKGDPKMRFLLGSNYEEPAASDAQGETPDYLIRNDGTEKGTGYLGILKNKLGQDVTEYAIGVDMNGKETEIPTLVPSLTDEEVQAVLDASAGDGEIPESVKRKAIKHAQERIAAGESPFAVSGDMPREEQESAPVSSYLLGNAGQQTQAQDQSGYPASPEAVQQQATGNTLGFNTALEFAKNNGIVGMLTNGVDSNASAPRQAAQAIKNYVPNIIENNPAARGFNHLMDTYGGDVKQGAAEFADEMFGTNLSEGSGKEETQKTEPKPSDDAVAKTLKNEGARESDVRDPQKRENIQQGLNEVIQKETPEQRVSTDERMMQLLQRETKKPTARQRYAMMRLAQSGVVSQQQMANYFENGRLVGSDLKDAIDVMKQRTDQVKAGTAAQRARTSARKEVRTGDEAMSTAQKKRVDTAIKNVSNIVSPAVQGNRELIAALKGNPKFKDGTGLELKEYVKSAIETELQNPENVAALSQGRTTNVDELHPVEVQAFGNFMKDYIGKWTRGKDKGFFDFSADVPANDGMFGDFNIRKYIRAGAEEAGQR